MVFQSECFGRQTLVYDTLFIIRTPQKKKKISELRRSVDDNTLLWFLVCKLLNQKMRMFFIISIVLQPLHVKQYELS